MPSNVEKIEIIDKRIEDIASLKNIILSYIDKVEAGMEEPDMNIDKCLGLIGDLELKKQSLLGLRSTISL